MLNLFELLPLSTVLNMLLLIIYVAVVTRVNSYTVVLAGATIIEILHLCLSTYLRRFFGIEEYAHLVYHAWYLTFAVTDFLLVLAVLYVCKRLNTPLQLSSRVVLSVFFFLGGLQVANYIERLYLNSAFSDTFYSKGIPILNGFITAVLFTQLVCELFTRRNQHEDDAF